MVLDRLLAAPFALGSRVRGARVFHPRGVAVRGTWEPDPEAADEALPGVGARPALVRVSHAIGLPPGLPDILGIAIRITDAYGQGRHQDLLLASSGTGSVSRHLLLPTAMVTGTVVSSLLPYDVAGVGRHPIVAHTVGADRPVTYPEVKQDPVRALPAIQVRVDAPRPRVLGTVRATEAVDEQEGRDLRLHPWNTGPGLRPAGVINRLRRPSYRASQEGRGAL